MTMTNESPIAALLIEDDAKLARLTAEYLAHGGIDVAHERTGERGLARLDVREFDIVLLDIMLPGIDGIEVCRRIRRRSHVPIIALTARTEEADRVLALELGADDYLGKPFSPRELLARIRAAVRRYRGRSGPESRRVVVGDLELDDATCAATLRGARLDLTAYEFALLYALAGNAGRALSRERLMELVTGSAEEAFDRSVDVHISRIRQKLCDDPQSPRRIRTVRGKGYMYLAPPREP
jgi:two-component system response regulator RstA